MVQLPERSGPIDGQFDSLADITRHRMRQVKLRLAVTPQTLDSSPMDLGFRAYRLSSSNFSIWEAEASSSRDVQQQLELAVEHVIEGASESSILTELLLKAGYQRTRLSRSGELRRNSGLLDS